MPKPVEAPNPYVSPPPANLEDMTQPLGPLEEGDQALVDAMHRLPAGQHEVRHDEAGGITWTNKTESLGQDIAVINMRAHDGTYNHASTLINKAPGMDGISADIGHSTPWDQGSGSRAYVSGNQIGSDVLRMKVGTHRKEAQAIKLEVAAQIDAAAQQLGHDAVEGAQH